MVKIDPIVELKSSVKLYIYGASFLNAKLELSAAMII